MGRTIVLILRRRDGIDIARLPPQTLLRVCGSDEPNARERAETEHGAVSNIDMLSDGNNSARTVGNIFV